MSISQKQIAHFRQINLDATAALADVAFRGAERLLTLNTAVGRTLLAAQAEHGRNLLTTRDPIELVAWQATFSTSCLTAGVGYARNLGVICQDSAREAGQVLEQHQVETQKWTENLSETLSRFVPGGAESLVSGLRSLVRVASGNLAKMFRTARRDRSAQSEPTQQPVSVPSVDLTPANELAIQRKAA